MPDEPIRATNGNVLMRCADEEGWPYRVFTPETLNDEGRAVDWTCSHCAYSQTSLASGCYELCLNATWHSLDLYAEYREEARAGYYDAPEEPTRFEGPGERLYVVPALIWCGGEDEELATDHVVKLLNDAGLIDQVPYVGPGRRVSRAQIENPDFHADVFYSACELPREEDENA